MKQEQVRLRSTAEQEEIDGEHLECVYEIVPMQDTVELHRCFLDESVDSTCKVFVSIIMLASLSFEVKEHIP